MSLSEFHDVRLPLPLAFGAQGGPERRTEVVSLASGGEARNAVWAGSRRRWDLGGAVTKIKQLHELTAFFEARSGRLHGFRFRDLVDDRSVRPGEDIAATDQVLGLGDGTRTVFELVKHYGDTARRIHKPVAGSVRAAIDGEEQLDVIVSTVRGDIRFATPPEAGAVVTAGFLFDVPVRFDADMLETSIEAFDAGRASAVPIIELLEV
ncbi:MAG: DUF2460 domain-containing protein [Hyphomonadaceae bacterium]